MITYHHINWLSGESATQFIGSLRSVYIVVVIFFERTDRSCLMKSKDLLSNVIALRSPNNQSSAPEDLTKRLIARFFLDSIKSAWLLHDLQGLPEFQQITDTLKQIVFWLQHVGAIF